MYHFSFRIRAARANLLFCSALSLANILGQSLGPTEDRANSSVVLAGTTNPAIHHATDLGRVVGSTRLSRLTFILRRTPEQQMALDVLLKDLQKASGWQPHSVRGFLSGTIRKKMGLTVTSTRGEDGERSYAVKG